MTENPVTEAELQAHVDGRLPPAREQAVLAWLSAHPEEARRIAAYRAQADALRQALDGIGDEPVPAALDLRLQLRRRTLWARLRPAAAAACAAGLLLAGGAGGWALRGQALPPQAGTAALAREAVSTYTVYASDTARPVELPASQRVALDSWFSKRLARPIRAPDLAPAGLTLIGGRLVATPHGAAALYLYRDGTGRRLAVYLRPMEVEQTARMQSRREGAVAGWTWADAGLGFGVFGTAPEADLHSAADLVRSQSRRV
ncbi:anti-sigma factor family protein [Sphingomonas azotifigens]|uniref:anti-sigma factor family protein n=1 Tax=Sphingomonas azotifigens TaxID=330920 RepID=UPI0009FC3FB2|nr:anti-sigma factor [Sphingomonas azotifigens]